MPPFLSHFLLLSTYVNLALCSYYCTNPGYECLNGGTCKYNGECNCTSGFQGFNCGLSSSTLSQAATCTVDCHNKGICFNGNQCYCTKDFMGPTCQQAYDYAECGTSSVKIKAYRPAAFNGEIFLMESMFGCKLQEVTSTIAGYKQFELDVPHNSAGPCKLHRTVDKMTGDATFAVNVSTVHRKGQFGTYDGLKTVSCHYSSRNQAIVTDVTNLDNFVTFNTMDGSNNIIQDIQANDNLFLKFDIVKLPAKFTRIMVLDLEMYTISEFGNVFVVPLMKDGCKTTQSDLFGASLSQQEVRRDGVTIPMKAVHINENIQGNTFFNYRLRFCKNPSMCEAPQNCPSGGRMPKLSGEIFKHNVQKGLRIN